MARASEGHLESAVLPLAQNQKASREVSIFDKINQPTIITYQLFLRRKEGIKKISIRIIKILF